MPFENTAEASARPITCVLIDVGGTLWPSGWSDLGAVEAARRANLAAALPELMPPRNVEFSERLAACAREPGMSGQAMTTLSRLSTLDFANRTTPCLRRPSRQGSVPRPSVS